MDRQAIADRIASHLLHQAKKAMERDFCRYRISDLSCAIGCLIRDEFYTPDFENCSVAKIEVQRAVAKSLGLLELSISDVNFLRTFQNIHDAPENLLRHWLRLLVRAYLNYGLDTHLLRMWCAFGKLPK